jgi:hypothetical protein
MRALSAGAESTRTGRLRPLQHQERPHQGLGNDLIAPEPSNNSPTGKIVEAERLGGLLRSYQRAA